MKTKMIIKALAAAMLMPAMLLTTACSNEDLALNNTANNTANNTVNKGYTLPVTVNVTRQGDNAGNRAAYDGTIKKLEFSTGDQLFIEGYLHTSELYFAGKLTWQSEGTFSGELSLSGEYEGTYAELFTAASGGSNQLTATLLPAGYESYGFLKIKEGASEQPYDDSLDTADDSKAIAHDKASAVEQFSLEQAITYSSGFALAPKYAIVSVTYKDEAVAPGTICKPALYYEGVKDFGGSLELKIGIGGVVTFAIGVDGSLSFEENWSLTDRSGNNCISANLGKKSLVAGNIYKWTNVPAPTATLVITTPAVGQVICSDGKNYDYATKPGLSVVAKICYVNGNHGLALAMTDEAITMDWSTAITTCFTRTPVFSNGTWKLATKGEWANMISASGGIAALRDFASVGGTDISGVYYWTSTQFDTTNAWVYDLSNNQVGESVKTLDYNVRACLEF